MEKQHEINSMGVVYVILLLGNIVIYTLSLILPNMGIQLPSTMCTVLCEIAILLPTIIYIKSKGDNISKRLGFHKIKITTVLLTVLLTLATTPIYIFTNLFSQLFVKNTVVQNSSEMLGGTAILTLIVVSVMAQNIDIVQEQEAVRSQTGAMLYAVIFWGFISVICVFLVWLLLKAIANNQGNLEAFKSSFARKDNLDAATDAGVRVHSLLNVPMVFSVLIGIAAMIIYQVTVL